MPSRQIGLTLLEVAFILVIMGVLASTLVPAIHSMHHKSLEESDRRALRTLKEAIIGQFLATGALPACKDAAGNPSPHGNCDARQSLGHLGLAVQDARNTPFRYDVWNAPASDLTVSDKTSACATLDVAIPVTGGTPAICAGVPDYNAPAAAYCVSVRPTHLRKRGGVEEDGVHHQR